MSGNRPRDVCALCDRPIDHTERAPDYHRYVGVGFVHGGGREYIAVHGSCLSLGCGSTGRVPGWVSEAERPEWLAEWDSRTGRFDRAFVHDEWHARFDGTGALDCHREFCARWPT